MRSRSLLFIGELGKLWIVWSFILHPICTVPCLAKIPWQKSTSVREETQYGELPSSVFAPGGRLYSVEGILRAVHDPLNPSSNIVVAIRYRDGVVILSTLPSSPYLFEEVMPFPSSLNHPTHPNVTHSGNRKATLLCGTSRQGYQYNPCPWVQLDSGIWGVTAGPVVDGQILKQRMMLAAKQAREEKGSARASALARSLADACQIQSQKASEGKLLACSGLIVQDDQLWRIDPNGQFWKCHAAVLGRAATVRIEEQLLAFLMKRHASMDGSTDMSTNSDADLLVLTHIEVQNLFGKISEDDAMEAAADALFNSLSLTLPNKREQEQATEEALDDDKLRGRHFLGMIVSKSKSRLLLHREIVAMLDRQ